jgi:heme exporter protein D
MSYLGYVVGAYAVFAAFLAWDFLVPRLRLARARRDIVLRARREQARAAGGTP